MTLMPGVDELITRLTRAGVELWVDEGQLKSRARKGAISVEDAAFIRAHKADIIERLSSDLASIRQEGACPLSFEQLRLWRAVELTGPSDAYNVPLFVRIQGHLDVETLGRAVVALLSRHAVLRSILIDTGDGEVHAMPLAVDPFALRRLACPSGQEPANVHAVLQAEAALPFDLRREIPTRCAYLAAEEEGYLCLTFHHIVVDAESVRILLSELSELYRALDQEESPRLSRDAVQYSAYVGWQRRQGSDPVLPAETAGDREEESRFLESDQCLVPDVGRQDVGRGPSRRYQTDAPSDLCPLIDAIGRRHKLTPFAVVQAVVSLYLAEISDAADFVVASPVTTRDASEFPDAVGFFVSDLMLRHVPRQHDSLETYLPRIRRRFVDAMRFRHVSVGRSADATGLDRASCVAPPQVIFAFQSPSASQMEMGGVPIQVIAFAPTTAKTDLVIYASLAADGLGLSWEYDSALFSCGYIQQVARGFVRFLCDVLRNPHVPIASAQLISPDSEQWLRAAQVPARAPTGRGLVESWHQSVARHGDRIAVVHGGRRIRYHELDAMSDRYAVQLKALGVCPGDRIGLLLPRSAECVLLMLAAAKTGAAYVPIDRNLPENGQRELLKKAQVKLLVGDGQPPPCSGWVELTLSEFDRLAMKSPAAPQPQPDPGSLLYVMFTSGSTGEAKGVPVSQRNVLAFADAPDYLPAEGASVAFSSPPSFDASTLEVWATLLNGHTLHVHAADRIDPSDYVEWLRAGRIGVAFITSALFEVLMCLDDVQLPALTHVLIGGDVVPPAAVRRFLAANPEAVCINGYGPTENTTFSTVHVICETDLLQSNVPIGRPVAGTGVAVVNDALQLVPPGQVGELILTGSQLVDGYWNLSSLTAQRFVSHPQDGTHWYRTGDRVRWNGRRLLEFVGRLDEQVKISGYRVELSEIRAHIEALAGVNAAVVLARKTALGVKVIHAFYKPGAGAPSEEEIMSELVATLPSYMVPARLESVDSFPLTRNGKIDHGRLLQSTDDDPTTPGTSLQGWDRQVSEAWQSVLARPCRDIDADFFAFGGHSLTATRLALRLGELIGRRVPLGDVFKHATVRTQAEYCRRHAALAPGVAAMRRLGLKRAPLSFSQRRLWVLDQLAQGPAFNIPMAVRLRGKLDRSSLEKALTALVARHEILRTRYLVEGDQPWQIVDDDARPTLNFVDCSLQRLPEQACLDMIAADAAAPFDLAKDLMLRAHLLSLSEDEVVLALNIHHIACDGWSIAILVEELSRLYAGYCSGQHSGLPELSLQYCDYAQWQSDHAQGMHFERQLRFWTERLTDLPTTHNLPLDRSRPDQPEGMGNVVSSHIPADLRGTIEAFAKAHQATPFAVVNAVFACLLARYSGETDIVVGTPVANREQPGLGEMVGFFVNTLVLRTDLSSNPTLRQLVATSKKDLADAFGAQSVPFEKLVEALQPERSASHGPLFQVMLSMHNNEEREVQFPGLSASPIRSNVLAAQHDLTVDVSASESGMFELGWEYAVELFDHDTVARMASHYRMLLERMLDSPDLPFQQIPLLTEAETAELRARWTGPAVVTPDDVCIHHLIELQAARTPDAVAVVCRDRSWTYGDIDYRANALARRLVDAGAVPEQCVGLCTGRGVELVVGMLGIMKAGAVFVPLEPGMPDARLGEIIEVASIALAVVQQEFANRSPLQSLSRIIIDEPVARAHPGSGLESPHVDSFAPCTGISADNAAYVVFTSGSTGKPKGVICEHRALVDRKHAWDRMLGLSDAPPVVLQMASLSVDICLGDVVKALASGGRLVVCSRDDLLSPEDLWALIRREGVTFGDFVPPVLRALAAHVAAAGQTLDGMRHVLVGCEPWFGRDLHLLQGVLGPATRCFNIYGQTESIIDAAYLDVTDLALAPGDVIQIGVPLANTELSVRSPSGQLQPIGVAGELCVAGPALARGYLGQPELTRANFLTLNESGCELRMYRTGDVVKRLVDGRIAFAGRADDQVKIRGYRVDLREVEEALQGLPLVQSCVALAKPTAAGNQTLVAYVTVECADRADRAGLVEAWRAALSLRLPDYMVPTAFSLLDAFPLSQTGKVDRQKLLQMAVEVAVPFRRVAPRTQLESELSEVWCSVLGLERVGVLDNFFSIGGDSIRVVQLVAEARRRGISFAARDVFTFQCVERMAEHIEHARERGAALDQDAGSALELLLAAHQCAHQIPAHASDAYPASALQTMMLTRHGSHDGIEGVYLPQQMFDFQDDGFRADYLHSALTLLINKHPILRAGFVARDDGQYLQVIRNSVTTPLAVVDLAELPPELQQSALQRHIAVDLASPFHTDDEHCALMRYTLFDLGSNRWNLLMSTHHAIDDGWSFVEFMNELFELYRLARSGELPAALAPSADVFKERVALEFEAASCERSELFWRSHLASAPHAPAPLAADPASSQPRYVTRTTAIDVTVLEGLTHVAREGGWQIKTAALLAYYRCLFDLAGGDVTVDIVSSGRSDRLSDPLHSLGLFWNFNPIHFAANEAGDPVLLERLQRLLIAASEHVLYPVETLRAAEAIPPAWASFNFVHFHNMQSTAGQGDTLRVVHESDRFHHPMNLMVSLDKSATRATVTLAGSSRHLSERDMDRFLVRYVDVLGRLGQMHRPASQSDASSALQPAC